MTPALGRCLRSEEPREPRSAGDEGQRGLGGSERCSWGSSSFVWLRGLDCQALSQSQADAVAGAAQGLSKYSFSAARSAVGTEVRQKHQGQHTWGHLGDSEFKKKNKQKS